MFFWRSSNQSAVSTTSKSRWKGHSFLQLRRFGHAGEQAFVQFLGRVVTRERQLGVQGGDQVLQGLGTARK